MAVRTKQPQLINAQFQFSDNVYFEIDPDDWGATVVNSKDGYVPAYRFVMHEYSLDVLGNRMPIMSIPILYKKSTFIQFFGNLSVNEILANADDNIITEIDRVNKIPFSTNRIQNVRYWDLTATDLEKVV